jgi:multidrug efflux pump subunit AcrB
MSMISYWKIRQHLLRVPGVANIAIWGERLQMLQVQAVPEKLKAHDVSINQVMDVTANALDAGLLQYSPGALIGTGGHIETPNQRLSIQHVLPIATPQDLAEVVIEERNGKPLRLGDVANVVEDHQPLIGDAVINQGPGLMLIVEKLPWGNTLEVTKGVEAALEQMKPGLSGITIAASRSTRRFSGPRPSSRSPWTTSAVRCCWAASWWCWCWERSSSSGGPRSSA